MRSLGTSSIKQSLWCEQFDRSGDAVMHSRSEAKGSNKASAGGKSRARPICRLMIHRPSLGAIGAALSQNVQLRESAMSNYDPQLALRQTIAGVLDHPSVYMGGPSRQNLRKADRIIERLRADPVLLEALRAEKETPADLVGALQDKVHTDSGPFRAGQSVKETIVRPDSCRCPAAPGEACKLTEAECRRRSEMNR